MNIENYRSDFVFIIPTLSNRDGLTKVLGLLHQYYPKAPCIIVNNGTNRQSFDKSNTSVVINNERNLGFAKACNQGAKKADEQNYPQYFIFLNDDVSFNTDWVTPCIEAMKQKKWFATTPVLMRSKTTVENLGYTVLPYGRVNLITSQQHKEILGGLSATALVVEKNSFFKLGGFDERFFAYLEDVDLFLRAKKHGLTFGVTKTAYVYHQGQATSSHMRAKKAYLDFRNWILLIWKNWDKKTLSENFLPILVERGRNFWGIIKTIFRI